MRYINFLMAVALSLLLCGCQYSSSKLAKYKPELGQPSALIIAKIDNADYVNIKRLTPVATDSQDADNPLYAPEYTIVHPIVSPFPYKYTESLYTIEPGTYYISYAYMDNPTDDNARTRTTKCQGLDREQQPIYGAFTVHEGDVLYLGDIKVNWRNSNPRQMFCMIDNLPCVKRDLNRAGYAELAQKIKLAEWQH